MSQQDFHRSISIQAIDEVIADLLDRVTNPSRPLEVLITDMNIEIEQEALKLWAERLLRHGRSILRYAKGVAVMRDSQVIELKDITRTFEMVNKNIHKELLGEEEEPTTW